ncbi:MAG: RagB/SusD family nutrient uptake outer membrane protein [Tannerella sp.]|jgi:hypothetical protein|nr:RagB/SusD family nutrient uptake outer membrane protein [Tannerella sp.]
MKKQNYTNKSGLTLFLIGALLLTGCDDFLERSSQNQFIPKTATDYKEVLQQEGYFRTFLDNAGKYAFVHYMTDDIEYFDALKEPGIPNNWRTDKVAEDEKVEFLANVFRWDLSIENELFKDASYAYLYTQVLAANICLEGVKTCEGTQAEKEITRGQASFVRAFAYLMLANLYAKPYASVLEHAASTDLCVPLKTTSAPTVDQYPRATIAEVWGLITSDIAQALADLKGKNREELNRYEINYPGALILAIRIALYMEDWDKVIELGEEFLKDYNTRFALYDITDRTTAGPRVVDENNPGVVKFMNSRNTEIVWPFGNRAYGSSRFGNQIGPMQSYNNISKYLRVSAKENGINKSLISMYQDKDRRKDYWFFAPIPGEMVYPSFRFDYETVKFTNSSSEVDILYANFGFRTAEVYLSLAEAYARKPSPDAGKAIERLNTLRAKRIADYTPLSTSAYSGNDLVQFVWDERRRELCFDEIHRWWDLRRTTQPRIKHQWRNNTYYILEEGDPGYVLNFPDVELSYNGSALVPNSRFQRTPIPE